jgi:hypothetical protein
MPALARVQDIFDRGGIGVVLIVMPGVERRLARYPQLYSRVGIVHVLRPLRAEEVRERLRQNWAPPGVSLPEEGFANEEAVAAMIRIAGGTLDCSTASSRRLPEINALENITREAVEAARESLVIGIT